MKSIRQKRIEAQQRKEDRSKRSPQQQLAILAKCPGDSKRERERLTAMIPAATVVVAPVAAPKPVKAKKAKPASK